MYVSEDQEYCYGDGVNEFTNPNEAFTFGWDTCCWVDLTADDGVDYEGGDMVQRMTIHDFNNNSPTFKLPPLWLIMSGCGNQSIDLAPIDPDGDIVRCRWATEEEAGGAVFQPAKHPSISLDQNCIVHYDGTLDSVAIGVKPIALMMEDIDMLGNVKSSIPVQFLGQVWTPMVQRNGALIPNATPYPKWFPEVDHHVRHTRDTHVMSRMLHDGRAKRSEPSYCTSVPIFVEPTPDDDALFGGNSGTVTFTLKAESPNGPITSFQYQAPSGLICSEVVNDQATCTFILTEEQMNIEDYSFCYDAVDVLGMVSNRRCLRNGLFFYECNILER